MHVFYKSLVVKRRFGTEVVLFDQRTGDTHLLSGPAGQLVEAINVVPMPQETVRSLLSGSARTAEIDFPLEQINRAVAELRALGLSE